MKADDLGWLLLGFVIVTMILSRKAAAADSAQKRLRDELPGGGFWV